MEALEFDFMQRALIIGLIIGFICPLMGVYVILKRQALIGDGLGHIAFAGVAGGWLLGIQPLISALLITVASAVGIEYLRTKKNQFADMVLAIFFYTGISIAIILSSISKINNMSILGDLFGSIVTVTSLDLYTISVLAIVVIIIMKKIHKQLVFAIYDEEAAKVSGIAVNKLNIVFAILTAITIALAMRIIGILLVSALIVIPAAASLYIATSFRQAIIYAIIIAECSVIVGLIGSFYLNIPAGGTIVLITVGIYILNIFTAKLRPLHKKAHCKIDEH